MVAAAALRAYSGNGAPGRLRITGREAELLYDLSRDEEIEVRGPLGCTVVQIRNGTARVISSPCPHQTCVQSGAISRTGQWIGCLPNGVFLTIEGGRSTDVDAVSF